ncbi:hypothetical protein EW145_g816 [Phellinidium pouzarii]|uniref:BRCT domain-containing protein n=1 Tax=Phellinidium pouzarii TaxID=167371 RepID=A0A4S4LHI1_9AGAM|nr:hypothetical protein EW145_g816 [Phellinidium pouzarii]
MSSSQSKSQIFVAPEGSPLPVFVESNGVSENRPRLIRTLRSHGATICSDVSLARIILVEPDSSEGRQFVRDWGLDPGKVILEVAWIQRCIDANRALLEDDGWAGCGNLDGTPLPGDVIDEEDQDPSHSPASSRRSAQKRSAHPWTSNIVSTSGSIPSSLPTPRQTPIERVSSQSEGYAENSHVASTLQRIPTPPSTSSSGSYTTRTPEPPFAQTQQLPPSFSPSMQTNPSMALSPYDAAIIGPPQFPNFQFTSQAMQSLLMSNPELMTAAMGMVMHGMAQPANGTQSWPGQSQAPGQQFMPPPSMFPPIQNQPMQPPQNMNGHLFSSPRQSQPQPLMSMSPQQMNSHYSQASMMPLQDHEFSPSIDHGPSFGCPSRTASPFSRFAISESPPPSTTAAAKKSIFSQKGKKRSHDSSGATGSSKSSRQRSRSPSASSSRRLQKKHVPSTSEFVTKDRSFPVGIFTTEDGSPMKFFLQVQIRNRIDLVHQVKKNGGKITPEMVDADYIILAPFTPHNQKIVDQWLKVVKDLGRSALRPSFIEACLEEKAIVEDCDFRFEPAKKRKKSTSKRKSSGQDSIEEVSLVSTKSSNSDKRFRSPTPPMGKIKLLSGGRHAFTPEEKAYALKYAAYLFRKKPEATFNLLGSDIARRVTTHPTASWINVLYAYRNEIEKLRSKVLSEKRDSAGKALTGTHNLANKVLPETRDVDEKVLPETRGLADKVGETEESEVEEVLLKAMDVDDTQAMVSSERRFGGKVTQTQNGKEELPQSVEADFKTIIDYFANPPEGLSEDEQLWAEIEKKYKCLTAATWQDFYKSHMDDVNQRLRKALNLPEPEVDQEDSPIEVSEAEAKATETSKR